MQTLNTAFFFVTDVILSIQAFFLNLAWGIARIVLLIAILSAGVNYALSGQGLKENIVKIVKAAAFFFLVMAGYPKIISFITSWTYEQANASAYSTIASYIEKAKADTAEAAEAMKSAGGQTTWAAEIATSKAVSENKDPLQYFSGIVQEHTYNGMAYTIVSPAAAMEAILLVAGGCIKYADDAPRIKGVLPDFSRVLKGMLCGFFVIFTGVFAVLEYLIAFLEFMLVAGVGVILFPLSLWEGSKFMAEKFIGAITGFFIKLLFCNIAVFLMFYGFLKLAKGYTERPFTGAPDEIVTVIFTSLLFFFICKSAPALAQSLLSGTPSLSASGAIGAVAGAAGAAGAALGMARSAGGAVASGAAKTAFAAAGTAAEAGGAVYGAIASGGTKGDAFAAAAGSIGRSAMEGLKATGGGLARSLLSDGSSSGSGGGVNPHSERQQFLQKSNADGTQQTFGQNLASRASRGVDRGLDSAARGEQVRKEAAQMKADYINNTSIEDKISDGLKTHGS